MIDTTLVVGDIIFRSHHGRALFIGMSRADRQQWLEKNKDAWQHVEEVQQVQTLMATSPGSTATTSPAEKSENQAMTESRTGAGADGNVEAINPPTKLTEKQWLDKLDAMEDRGCRFPMEELTVNELSQMREAGPTCAEMVAIEVDRRVNPVPTEQPEPPIGYFQRPK
jgi:hypothetical protein